MLKYFSTYSPDEVEVWDVGIAWEIMAISRVFLRGGPAMWPRTDGSGALYFPELPKEGRRHLWLSKYEVGVGMNGDRIKPIHAAS